MQLKNDLACFALCTCVLEAKDYVEKITSLGKLCLLVTTFSESIMANAKREYHTLAYDAQYIIVCLLRYRLLVCNTH